MAPVSEEELNGIGEKSALFQDFQQNSKEIRVTGVSNFPSNSAKVEELKKVAKSFLINCDEYSNEIQKCLEAILDAGHHPSDFENTKTGVYVEEDTSTIRSESLARSISKFFKLKGTSFECKSSLFALNEAFLDLKNGKSDMALVYGSKPLQYFWTKKPTESEKSYCFLLQKGNQFKNFYSSIIHVKTLLNDNGIPTTGNQKRMLEDFYVECKIDNLMIKSLNISEITNGQEQNGHSSNGHQPTSAYFLKCISRENKTGNVIDEGGLMVLSSFELSGNIAHVLFKLNMNNYNEELINIFETDESNETNLENGAKNEIILDSSVLFGRMLANPPPGEEVCITGLSGAYPNSENVEVFTNNLFTKTDMIDDDERRWPKFHPEVPQRTGKIPKLDELDAGFFGIHYQQAHEMDPGLRVLYEKTIESIIDAGLNPSDLEGTRTGVFLGMCWAETEADLFLDKLHPQTKALTGALKTMVANRISYLLKLKGPSLVADTACSSSSYAFENAYVALRKGECDAALVLGCNLCIHPFVSLQFFRLGVLSEEGRCASFDEKGNGYCRSEAVCSMLLQKSKNSKRIYAKVVHAKTNCDGFKDSGITFPSRDLQQQLLEEFYNECQVDPKSLTYLEAHATGTKVGDPEEFHAIDSVFCKGRKTPLHVGSIKSNIGHTEPVSGLCSISKCIIAMETGFIPPNLHFNKPRPEFRSILEGRCKVVAEKTPLPDNRGLMAANSFGFGGANAHILIKWNDKSKMNDGKPMDDIPRLVCVSGRTPEAVPAILRDVYEKYDVEHIRLLHEVFRENIENHQYRGYGIASKNGQISSSFRRISSIKTDLVIIFGQFYESWQILTRALMKFSIFDEVIGKMRRILENNGVNFDTFMNESTVMNKIIGNTALQIGIIELIKALRLKPLNIFGYSMGELARGFYEKTLNLEQTILIALEIGKFLNDESNNFHVVTMLPEELPKNVEFIRKYSETQSLITGKREIVHDFIKKLKEKGVNVHEIGIDELLQHSGKFTIKEKLKKVMPDSFSIESLMESISTGFNPENWNFPNKSSILEIGNGDLSKLLQPNLNKTFTFFNFNLKEKHDGILTFLEILGKIHEIGINLHLQNIYPDVQFPVSRGTPMISSSIKWNHKMKWNVMDYKKNVDMKNATYRISVSTEKQEWEFVKGHVIDGRNLFPATGYLFMVFTIFTRTDSSKNVVFENCKFHRATTVGPKKIDFFIQIHDVSGNFEVSEGDATVVSGRIRFANENEEVITPLKIPFESNKEIPLNSKDVYKELRLRGYNYSGAFKKIRECNKDATKAKLEWDSNWISFMDNMLQLKILQADSRLLCVPTEIRTLYMNYKDHLDYAEKFGNNPSLPVYSHKESGIIQCGFIEIRGLKATPISRKKETKFPILESYEFVPNELDGNLEKSLKINMQIALENLYQVKLQVIELIDEENEEFPPLGPMVFEKFSEQPLIQAQIIALGKIENDLPNVTVETKMLRDYNDCFLIIGSKLLQKPTILQQVFGALKENGFVLSREDKTFTFDSENTELGIDILTIHNIGNEKLILFRKTQKVDQRKNAVIKISEDISQFDWLKLLQNEIKKKSDILLYSEFGELNGILGLFNCIKREYVGINLRCLVIYGSENVPKFDIDHPFYKNQLDKNMCVNIFKNNQWGTYRHLTLNHVKEVESEQCYVKNTLHGDLSSLKWIQGSFSSKSIVPQEESLVHVYYASLNFRDVMLATGRIQGVNINRLENEKGVLGFEFSGKDSNGKRVMGFATNGGISTMIKADNYLLYDIPESWTIEEAATVPAIYSTVLYALFERGKMKRGESILIHSGTGGVGQAAINVALAYDCKVFTTVGTPEKREFIKKLFPTLKDNQIGNSRDLSFEKMIRRETNGRGVDLVLNSLAEEKLIASVRCLARNGRFLEIGKFDLENNNRVALMLLEKECTLHGVMLDQFFQAHSTLKHLISQILKEGMKNGLVKPISTTVFKKDQVEEAFRFMSSGKHTGKVLIQIREEDDKTAVPTSIISKGLFSYSCDPNQSFIILGGLGGFGLELADWLVLRGARKLILTSRTGVKTGYQTYRLSIWNSYGVIVKISTVDVTTKEGCEQLITEAEKLGPVSSIFNLAVVLNDALLENQTEESFRISFGPKAIATKYLDEITRKRCPELRDFVIFSSVSCGRGNAGQTNYGMANSIMERICEERRKNGYLALAIEWGAIGDVGLVAEMQENHTQMEIGGTLQQTISSCLQVMNKLLGQDTATIVSSIVVAEKKSSNSNNLVDAIADIIGVNVKIVAPHSTLAELGMDSMTATEIKQTLERDFEIFLTAQDIRGLTLAKLREMQENADNKKNSEGSVSAKPQIRGLDLLMENFGNLENIDYPVINLPSLVENDSKAPYVFFFPGIEGVATNLKPLAEKMKAKVIALQWSAKLKYSSYEQLAEDALTQIENYVQPNDTVHIVAHSWGSIIGLETMSRLERKNHKGTLNIIDGTPDMLKEMLTAELLQQTSDENIETAVLCRILLGAKIPIEKILKSKDSMLKCSNFDERNELFLNETKFIDLPDEYKKSYSTTICQRLKDLLKYDPKYEQIKARTIVYKPTIPTIVNNAIPEDYNINKYCENVQNIKIVNGDHVTMLQDDLLADSVNELIIGD